MKQVDVVGITGGEREQVPTLCRMAETCVRLVPETP